MNTNKNTNASAKKTTFTTKEVAEMLGITLSGFTSYLFLHKELRTSVPDCWTIEQINKISQLRNSNNRTKKNLIPTAITVTEKTTTVSANTTTSQTLVDMFDAFLEIEKEEEESENKVTNRKFRYLFDNMSEKDLQEFFKPLTERFKYSYIVKEVEDIQSQTLTCIRKGRLKGMLKYKLTYKAFLKLCKFAAENNCPLNIPQMQNNNL